MGVTPILAEEALAGSLRQRMSEGGLIIDALTGYRLSGPPRDVLAEMVQAANDVPVPVLALDVPSGLDSTTGEAGPDTLRADATLPLALPKPGLLAAEASVYRGRLYRADIGIPHDLYAAFGISMPAIFRGESYLALPVS